MTATFGDEASNRKINKAGIAFLKDRDDGAELSNGRMPTATSPLASFVAALGRQLRDGVKAPDSGIVEGL
jgi:hypothetical protein